MEQEDKGQLCGEGKRAEVGPHPTHPPSPPAKGGAYRGRCSISILPSSLVPSLLQPFALYRSIISVYKRRVCKHQGALQNVHKRNCLQFLSLPVQYRDAHLDSRSWPAKSRWPHRSSDTPISRAKSCAYV